MNTLVNPVIIGTFETTFNDGSPIDAAHYFWRNFSKLILNNIPKMYFTLLDNESKLHHYKVVENVNGSGIVDYVIIELRPLDKLIEKSIMDNYNRIVNQFTMHGGSSDKKRKRYKYDTDTLNDDEDDSSSSSSSDDEDDDEFIDRIKKIKKYKNKSIITYYNFIPFNYESFDQKVYMPTFIGSIVPHYVEIDLPRIIWN